MLYAYPVAMVALTFFLLVYKTFFRDNFASNIHHYNTRPALLSSLEISPRATLVHCCNLSLCLMFIGCSTERSNAQWRKQWNLGNQGLQKVSKSKTLPRAHFWSNYDLTFLVMQNYSNFGQNVLLCQNSQILCVIFGFVCEKNWTAGQINLRLGMQKI